MTQPTPIWRCECSLWTDGTRCWGSLAEATSHGVMDYERKHKCPDCIAGKSTGLTLMRMREARRLSTRRAWRPANEVRIGRGRK